MRLLRSIGAWLFGHPLTALLVVWAVFNWCDTVGHVVSEYNPLPVSDYWRVVEDLPGILRSDAGVFWRQHNEHRIVFPELVFAADMLWMQGRQLLPTVLNLLMYAGLCAFVGYLFWSGTEGQTKVASHSADEATRSPASSAVTMFAVVSGWSVCTFVIGVPFLLQWTMLQAEVVCALGLLARAGRSPGWLAGLIACLAAAVFTSANGMLLLPICVGGAILLGWPKKQVALLAICGAIPVALFFYRYQFIHHGPAGAALLHPLLICGFVLSYLSMPFGVIRAPWIGLVFGALHVVLWLVVVLRNRSGNRPENGATLMTVTLGYAFMTALTALATAWGRAAGMDAGFGAAKAGRYTTMALLSWAMVLALIIQMAGQSRGKAWTRGRVTMAVAIVLVFMQVRLLRWQRSNAETIAMQKMSALSLRSGLVEDALLQPVFPSTTFVRSHLQLLREHRLSVYAPDQLHRIGEVLAIGSQSNAASCLTAEAGQAFETGDELAGTVRSRKCGVTSGTQLYVVTSKGKLCGFGLGLSRNRWTAFSSSLCERKSQSPLWIAKQDRQGQFTRLGEVPAEAKHLSGKAWPG